MITDPFATLGVVPIFVNAGAALVPTIVASVGSVAAVLVKPKELLALFRRKPWLPVAILAIGLGIWFLVAHWPASTAQAATNRKTAEQAVPNKTDWTAKAFKLIDDELNASKTTGVKPLWNYSPISDAMVLSSPDFAPSANRVFGTAAVQDVASFFGMIYCVDAVTGREIWKTDKVDGEDLKPFFSSPVLTADGKSLIVGQGLHSDADCYLLCFNADTGAVRWKVRTPLHIESSPAVRGDVAVVGAGAIEDAASHKPTGDPGYVFAVRISDGQQLWKHPVNDPESSPAFGDDGTVYIGSGFNGNAVVALRSESDDELKANGLKRELWKTPAPYPITGPVTIDGDLVLVGGGNSDFVYAAPNPAGVVLAIDRKDGSVKWRANTEDAVLNRIVVSGGKVFCPVRNGQVVALNLADGTPAWWQPVSGKSPIKAGVAVANNTVFAAASDGTLALLAASDGRVIERHVLNARGKPGKEGLTVSTPTLAGDLLFVGSETGGLRSFQAVKAGR